MQKPLAKSAHTKRSDVAVPSMAHQLTMAILHTVPFFPSLVAVSTI